ncbi:MAG: DUF308 domain-containing protein [Treponema sp.]|uniref:DUF308 domain-containing protein n=1 Tax=Treponema sp. TaxID=166 RepID=UPI001B225DB8|nr:DUF308 domain-containing protein [Treponema sp.]MBO6219644.1 DUF308 domain-containing protein [Treponema sp.]MBQ8680291.1 DUF308 domain-containing protein [Treponema sp.]
MDKSKVFLGFVTAALGLFLLISPDTFISFFVIILGVAAIIDGIFILAATRDLIIDPQYKLIVTVRGVLSIVVGLLAVILPIAVAAVVWKAMAYTLAIYLIISAGMQIYTITKLHRNGIMVRQSMIEVASSLLIALVLFVIPAQTAGHFIIRLFGIALLVVGIGLLVIQWKSRPEVVLPDSVETVEDEKSEE